MDKVGAQEEYNLIILLLGPHVLPLHRPMVQVRVRGLV